MSIASYIEDIPYLGTATVPFSGGSHYYLPLKYKLTFKSRDGEDTYYTFDSFINNNPINVIYCDAENAIGETGVTNILIEDSARDIDTSLIDKGNKVIVQIAKEQSEFVEPWTYFLVGYVRGFRTQRPRTNELLYELRAYGTKVIWSERLINMKKSTRNPKTSHELKNLIRSLIKDRASYPYKNTISGQIKGLSTADIADELTMQVSSVNFELMQASIGMENLVNIAGYRWFIDHTAGNEVVNVSHPTSDNTGVIIKSGDLANIVTDNAEKTSYFYGPWDADSDISSFSGYANRLITKTQIDRKEVVANFTNQGSVSLSNKAIAQKVQVFETRLTDLGLNLSKVGEPESPQDRVNGRVIMDNGNKPTGAVIAHFHIPLGDIQPTMETVFVNELTGSKDVNPGDFIWIVLYQRSGKIGSPNVDELNTIRWHHDNNLTTTTPNVSMMSIGGDIDKVQDWKYTIAADKGPTFNFGVFSRIRHIQEVSDRQAIGQYGLIEAEIDTSFLEDPDSINLYLNSLLQFTARPRVLFTVNAVRCPDKFLFKPYQQVTIQDTLAYPNGIEAEIQRARYVFSAEPGSTFAQGCKFVEITPMGFESFLESRFKCP
jgi:hypothetical protein